jgi:hypothetical protein
MSVNIATEWLVNLHELAGSAQFGQKPHLGLVGNASRIGPIGSKWGRQKSSLGICSAKRAVPGSMARPATDGGPQRALLQLTAPCWCGGKAGKGKAAGRKPKKRGRRRPGNRG